MNKLFWRLRYTYYLHKYTRVGLKFSWSASGISLEEFPEGIEDPPKWAVMEEISYWD